MDTRSTIQELINGIKENMDKSVINQHLQNIANNISTASKFATFYELPINVLSSIVNKVDFNKEDNPASLLKTIITGSSKSHKEEAIILLNTFTNDKLPDLTSEEIIDIISQFKSSALLTKLGRQNRDRKDYIWENQQLYEELQQYEQQIEELKNKFGQIQSEESNETESVSDLFGAIQNGNLDQVRALTEEPDFDVNAKITCYRYVKDGERFFSRIQEGKGCQGGCRRGCSAGRYVCRTRCRRRPLQLLMTVDR